MNFLFLKLPNQPDNKLKKIQKANLPLQHLKHTTVKMKTENIIKKIVQFVTVMLIIIPLSSAAISAPPVGTPSEGWKEWSMYLDETKPPKDLGEDDFKELLGIINSIGMFFRAMPSLNPPAGVEVSPSRNILRRVGANGVRALGIKSTTPILPEKHPIREWPKDGNGPLRAEFSIRIFRPEFSYRNPSCMIRVQINDPWLDGRLVFEDSEGGIYLLWPEEPSRDGRLRYRVDKKTVVEKILPAGRKPWIPVSRQRWIKLLIAKSEQTLNDRQTQITGSADKRRRQFNQSYEMMKSLDAEQAEKMRENFESNEKIYAKHAAAIASGDYDALEAAGERGLAVLGRHLIALREELASLTPEQLSAPAYGFEYNPHQYWMPRRAPKRPSLLMEQGDENALPLLAPNPDFFRKDLSAGEIQSITIINRLWEEYDSAVNAELDWKKLEEMVK